MAELWRVELLGGLRAVHPDRVVTRFCTQKAGALPAYLAFYRHRAHSREHLIETFWPEVELFRSCRSAAGGNQALTY